MASKSQSLANIKNMPKKKTRNSRKKNLLNETNLRAIVALFILGIAFAVFLLFYAYQGSIITNSFKLFMTLVALLFALLVALLFLINPRK